jgi:prepilin-type N-terminal cleavage/methylation domain-containing protein
MTCPSRIRAGSRLRASRLGLTLVEILVVVGIIAVLASLIMPVLLRAQQESYQTLCASNLRQTIQAVHMYAKDYDGHAPPYHNRYNKWREENDPEDSTRRAQPERLRNALLPYAGDGRIFFCRADKYAGQGIIPESERPYLVPINHQYWSYHVSARMGVDAPVSISMPLLTDPNNQEAPPRLRDPSTVLYALDVGPVHENRAQIRVYLSGNIGTKLWPPAD